MVTQMLYNNLFSHGVFPKLPKCGTVLLFFEKGILKVLIITNQILVYRLKIFKKVTKGRVFEIL